MLTRTTLPATLLLIVDQSHVCLGGRCLIDCSTPPPSGTGSVNGTNGNCSGLANSVCVAAAGSTAGNYTTGSYCGFSNGVCATGDCGSGLWQCQGSWDNSSEGSGTLTILAGPAPPASVFELTDAGTNTTYDASNIGGYNTAVGYTVPTAAPISCAYSPVSCVSDLNTSCPSLLQITEAPAHRPGRSAVEPGDIVGAELVSVVRLDQKLRQQ